MKFNQWTLGLAALGVVSLASAAKAEEKMTPVQAALSSTTISGYVDTSAQWNIGDHTQGAGQNGFGNLPPYTFGGSSKADGFNLNVVQLTIAKPLDESEWAAGYRADLWFGADANGLSTQLGSEEVAIRQAYVALRVPFGNGLDVKVGTFDTIVGYETLESGNNPNYSRSLGFGIEPTTHTGVLGTYRFSDTFSASLGLANTYGPNISERPKTGINGTNDDEAEECKTILANVALTAPDSWGWAAGSSLYLGYILGYDNAYPNNPTAATIPTGDNVAHYYAGATLALPVTGLKVGAAFDYRDIDSGSIWVAGVYASFQATEKLGFHARGEYGTAENAPGSGLEDINNWELTGTIQYDLWENVISRLEIRYDNSPDGDVYGRNSDEQSATMVAANFIYKF